MNRNTLEKYFLYSPMNGDTYFFRTEAEMLEFAKKEISEYLDDDYSSWSEEVEGLRGGVVTHIPTVLDKEVRPAVIDEDDYWPEGVLWRGNYTLEKLDDLPEF